MKLLIKQLTKEILKNKIFVTLMFILTIFTSSMYFFVHFSADKNLLRLNSLSALSENQILYRNGMLSNITLANNFLLTLIALTGFVFAMFFYRFLKNGSKELGCLKSLGFKDAALRGCFVGFSGLISVIGSFLGMVFSYFISDVLIKASMQSYLVSNPIKGLNVSSVLIGILAPASVFCLVTFFMYNIIHGKETGLLIAGTGNKSAYTATLRAANKISDFCPAKNRLSVRLSLRKPIAVLLIIISVVTFCVMFIMAYSLTLSSPKVFESQVTGHHYLYETYFDVPRSDAPLSGMAYLEANGVIEGKNLSASRIIAGIEENPDIFELLDKNLNRVELPKAGQAVIGSELQELYGFKAGDEITIFAGAGKRSMTISAVAFNAKSNCIYVSKSELCQMLSLPENSYTGVLSMESVLGGDTVITNEQRLDALQRAAVSNKISAIINQSVGCLVGCILLFLALFLNFEDSTRDILILYLMGYQIKDIRKMLIDIYKPILWLSFILSLYPSVLIVKSILKSLSMQIGDYMPFQTNTFVIIGVFLVLNLVYFLVQTTFNIGIRRIIKGENMADYTNS